MDVTPPPEKARLSSDESASAAEEMVSPDSAPAPAPSRVPVARSVSFQAFAENENDDEFAFHGEFGEGGAEGMSPGDMPFSPAPTEAPAFLQPPKPEFDDWRGLGDRYELSKVVGSGSYGKVAEAFDRPGQAGGGLRVAIKQCQGVFGVLKEARQMLRELHILRKLSGSDQIIKLLDVMAPPHASGRPYKDLYLVFEWADMDLHKLIHSPQHLTIRHVQSFAYQILKAVKYMQSANVIHRDLKVIARAPRSRRRRRLSWLPS